MEHDLKCWPQYFQAIKRGDKTFELRKNDRPFHAGDTLRLREFDPATCAYSGDELIKYAPYIMAGGGLHFGLIEGYVCMSIVDPIKPADAKGE